MPESPAIDWSDLVQNGGPAVQPGTYRARIEDLELAGTAPNHVLRVFLEILDPEYPGGTVVDQLAISETESPRWRALHVAAGVAHREAGDLPPLGEYIGRELEVHLDLGEVRLGRRTVIVRSYGSLDLDGAQ